MANAFINVYKNNPTAGGTDGTVVSTAGVYSEPVTVSLNASVNETKVVKLAIRCAQGYVTNTDTTISAGATTDANDKWKLCLTESGTFTDSITIPAPIGATNVIFYAKAFSADTESPGYDTSASLLVETIVTTAT